MAKGSPAKQLEAEVFKSQQGSYLQSLLTFVRYEQGKDSNIVVRMPDNVEAFNEIFNLIQAQAKKMAYRAVRKSRWPTAIELSELLGSVRWLWKNWIPIGFVTLLVGEPGSGKSFLELDWVRRILLEEPWPLSVDVPRGKSPCAIWIETESSQQLVTTRSASMGIPGERLFMPGFGDDLLGQPDLLQEGDRTHITRAVEDLKPMLLVLDSLGGAHTGGENKIEDVRPMLDFMARLSRDQKIPCVAAHHLRKRSPGESVEVSMDRVRGSSAFSAFARSIIAVEGMAGGKQSVRVIKSNLGPKPKALSFEIEFNGEEQARQITYAEFKPPQPKITKAQRCAEWVWEELGKKGALEEGVRLSQLVERASPHGFTRGMLYAAQEVLEERLEVSGDGRKAVWKRAPEADYSILCEE